METRATHVVTAVFGTLAGIAGIEHGVGEILQGNVRPEGLMILSWPGSPFFKILGGEPAMTLVPNLLLSGLLSVALSLLMIVWVLRYAHRPLGGIGLMAISLALLLVGGGFGPPVLAIIVALAVSRIRSTHEWARRLPHALLSRAFPWILACAMATWLGLLLGVPALNYLAGVESEALVLATIASAFGLLALTIATGFAHDARPVQPQIP